MFGCADADKNQALEISGHIGFDNSLTDTGGTLFVVIAKGSDISAVIDSVEETAVALYPVENPDGAYRIDLTETGLRPGDKIMIIGFYDADYKNTIPYPDKGDWIGFYYENETMQAAYTIKASKNFNIDLNVTRRVYSFETSVSGRIKSDYTGNIVMLGYAGEINSLDFSRLDFDKIIAYDAFTKETPEMQYNVSIIPYGFDLPIENVYFFAIFDANSNNLPDGGEWFGYYSNGSDKSPGLISLGPGKNQNIDIAPVIQLKPESDESIVLKGTITMPDAYMDAPKKDRFIILSKPVNPAEIMKSLPDTILYFERLQNDCDRYMINPAKAGIKKGDELLVIVLWDKDYEKGFPMLTSGDFIGYYFDNEGISLHYQVKAEEGKPINIIVNKEVYDYEKEIKGTIRESEALKATGISYSGELLVYAYNGDISSLDYSKLDYDKMIGFKKILKQDASDLNYQLTLLPFGSDLPINHLYLFALYDQNKNGRPDGGECFGYHSAGDDGVPCPVTITALSDDAVDITMMKAIPVASGDKIYLSGSIIMPDAYAGAENTNTFVVILNDSNPEDIIDSKIDDIVWFEQVPENETYYHIDLSETALLAGDRICVFVLWDRDNRSHFPDLSRGDFVGYYIDKLNMSNIYSLVSGSNPNVDILVDKEVFDFDKIISGRIINDQLPETAGAGYIGQVVLFAYSGEFESLSLSNLRYEKIAGYKKIEKTTAGDPGYELSILPIGNELPISNVCLFALYDENRNGRPDSGEYYGYHMSSAGLPEMITIDEDRPLADTMNIHMIRRVPVPSGQTISLKGRACFNMLGTAVTEGFDTGAQNQAAFVIITEDLNRPGAVLNDLSGSVGKAVIYFEKIRGGLTDGMLDYSVDLSQTGVKKGDKITVALLWENDFSAGFPLPSRGDYLGIYQDKANYDISFSLAEGENDITPSEGLDPYEGWHFDVNRKICFNPPYKECGVVFTVKSSLFKLNGGDTLFFIAAHDTGVAGTDMDTDYAVIIDLTMLEGTGEVPEITKTAYLLPALFERIVNQDADGNFVSIDQVKMMAFVDKNNNHKFDDGDYYGYYNKMHSGFTMSEVSIPTDPEKNQIIIPLVHKK